jgi:hypothetical protein
VASCPDGWVITGGGFRADSVTVNDSRQGPQFIFGNPDNTWYVEASTAFLQSGTVEAWATRVKFA